MIYYYAHTGHKVGLERARRGVTILRQLEAAGKEVQLLVNDFRAGVAMKEEQGLKEYVNIETVQDIDAIAQMGDSVIIDSDEDDHGRLVKYCADFKKVYRFAHDENDTSIHGETLLRPDCQSPECEDAVIVDAEYFSESPKTERVLFFLRDYDHDKTILNNADFFNLFDMELLLGHYFFVKYENELEKLFATLHEPEEYTGLIRSSTTVVTASAQTAVEAKAGGAKVIFLLLENKLPLYPVKLLEVFGITVVNGFDVDALNTALNNENPEATKSLKAFSADTLLKEL